MSNSFSWPLWTPDCVSPIRIGKVAFGCARFRRTPAVGMLRLLPLVADV